MQLFELNKVLADDNFHGLYLELAKYSTSMQRVCKYQKKKNSWGEVNA